MKQILVVTAHPDDESLFCGGTIAKYADKHYRVDLLVATRGEGGKSAQEENISWDELADIRVKELSKAAAILGISTVSYMGYKDGYLSDQEPGEIEEKIYQHMLKHIPDIVITFEPNGISNHKDHKKISLSTTYAFQKYASYIYRKIHQVETAEIEDENKIIDEPKLYYACIPKRVIDFLKKQTILPDDMYGKPFVGIPDKKITTIIDISEYSIKKIQAAEAHATQAFDVKRFTGFVKHPLLKQEFFMLRMNGKDEVYMGNYEHISDKL